MVLREERSMTNEKYPNKIVYNRKSPKNEDEYIDAYNKINHRSKKDDNLDVSAVITKNGDRGHALLNQSKNRSKDDEAHIGKNFIPDDILRKKINK